MADLKDLTVEGFVQITSSDEPAPGGGSVSALAGALGAALAEMVARLTTGREKYADAEEAMQLVLKEAAQIKEDLLLAIQKDSSSFEQYMTALSLPKSTEEEKAARRAAMQDGLKAAAQVPMSVARTAGRILPLARLAGELDHVRLRGLMSIPPVPVHPADSRPYFLKMHQLFVDIREKMSDNQSAMDCLSMGMSGDYEEAVAQGATLVRVGTALFGPRPPMGAPR